MIRSQEPGVRNSLFEDWILDIGHWMLNLLASPSRRRPRAAGWLLLAVLTAQTTHAQLGPFPIVTEQATFEASLVKRDKDILWVQRRSADGSRAPQVGLAVADIQEVRMPRPSLFEAVERILALPEPSDARLARAHALLDKFILQTRSLRDIPGIPADEGVLLKGRLYHRKGLWREAIREFEDVITHSPGTETATNAQILAGIAYAKAGDHHFAIEYLAGMPLPEENEALLSELLYALGNSYLALENYDNALLSYLPLVVFYPYVHGNEARGLAAVLPCYANLGEWEPLYRTIQEIKRLYPGTPAEQVADEFIEQYRDDLAKAGQFVDGDRVVEPPADTADPSTSGNPDLDIEYPDDL